LQSEKVLKSFSKTEKNSVLTPARVENCNKRNCSFILKVHHSSTFILLRETFVAKVRRDILIVRRKEILEKEALSLISHKNLKHFFCVFFEDSVVLLIYLL
jgi:hypothetical protein